MEKEVGVILDVMVALVFVISLILLLTLSYRFIREAIIDHRWWRDKALEKKILERAISKVGDSPDVEFFKKPISQAKALGECMDSLNRKIEDLHDKCDYPDWPIENLAITTPYTFHDISDFRKLTGLNSSETKRVIDVLMKSGIPDLKDVNTLCKIGYFIVSDSKPLSYRDLSEGEDLCEIVMLKNETTNKRFPATMTTHRDGIISVEYPGQEAGDIVSFCDTEDAQPSTLCEEANKHKVKAKHIHLKFREILRESSWERVGTNPSKEMATLYVDGIISVTGGKGIEYWKKVKQEIDKL